MPIQLSSIRNELLPGLRRVTGDYKQLETQWSTYYTNQGTSKMAVERTSAVAYLPLAELKGEGAATAFSNNAGDRFIYNQVHNEIGLGYAVTRKAIDDNLYRAQFNPSNLGLNKSFTQTKEVLAASVLNTATTYDATIVGDGKALCATDHPIDGGTIANRPSTDLDLNEAAIYSAAFAIRKFKDNAGLRMLCKPRKLIVPLELEYVAERLTKTELRPGTTNNDINAIVSTNMFSDGYKAVNYLTSAFSWFILTDADEGLLYLSRVPYEVSMQPDFTTDNLLVKGYERYSFGYDGFRGIYGSFPTS